MTRVDKIREHMQRNSAAIATAQQDIAKMEENIALARVRIARLASTNEWLQDELLEAETWLERR